MCVGVPAMIMGVEGEMAKVRYGSLEGRVCVALVPDVEVGDYVIVHAGFAIEKLDQEAAEETIRLLTEVARSSDPV